MTPRDPAYEQELAHLRYIIYLTRMMRREFEKRRDYGSMVFAEAQYRSARNRYRQAVS